jgi:transcriptional regulator with XRE-family HTH domain
MLHSHHGKIAYMADSIGDRIKIARKKAGLTQQKLAERVRVSRAAVAQWESGETKGLKPENLVLAAEKLAISIKWLAIGEGSMNSSPSDIPDQVLRLARLIAKAPAEKVQAISILLGEQNLDIAGKHEESRKESAKERMPLPPTVTISDPKERSKRTRERLQEKKVGGNHHG